MHNVPFTVRTYAGRRELIAEDSFIAAQTGRVRSSCWEEKLDKLRINHWSSPLGDTGDSPSLSTEIRCSTSTTRSGLAAAWLIGMVPSGLRIYESPGSLRSVSSRTGGVNSGLELGEVFQFSVTNTGLQNVPNLQRFGRLVHVAKTKPQIRHTTLRKPKRFRNKKKCFGFFRSEQLGVSKIPSISLKKKK